MEEKPQSKSHFRFCLLGFFYSFLSRIAARDNALNFLLTTASVLYRYFSSIRLRLRLGSVACSCHDSTSFLSWMNTFPWLFHFLLSLCSIFSCLNKVQFAVTAQMMKTFGFFPLKMLMEIMIALEIMPVYIILYDANICNANYIFFFKQRVR